MFKKIIVLFVYILTFLNFSKANSFNIDNLSTVLFQNTAQGINNDFTYYTLSKQNNRASPTYIDFNNHFFKCFFI